MANTIFTLLSPFKMNLGEAAVLALLGLVIVFAVLAVLVGILTVFKLVFNIKLPAKKSDGEVATMPEIATGGGENDEELVAVITAAIACMDGEETVKAPFVIKSITELK